MIQIVGWLVGVRQAQACQASGGVPPTIAGEAPPVGVRVSQPPLTPCQEDNVLAGHQKTGSGACQANVQSHTLHRQRGSPNAAPTTRRAAMPYNCAHISNNIAGRIADCSADCIADHNAYHIGAHEPPKSRRAVTPHD